MTLNATPLRRAAGRFRVLFRPSAVPDRLLAAALIALSAVVALAYIWVWSPLNLAPDEAHYWDWSRNLDWSYYSKGPLVAWLIRGGWELLGPLSERLTGDLAAAVRTPAVACHVALLAGWYVLASSVLRSPRAGLAMVAVAAALPLVRVGAVVMTIDPPFLACWCWALVCVWKAVGPRRTGSEAGPTGERGGHVVSPSARRAGEGSPHPTDRLGWWIGAGVLTAVGVLAKYTMALFPAAVVGFLLFHRRAEFRRPGVWVFLAAGVLGWAPVLVWNGEHGWVTFRHVSGQVGGGGAGGFRWLGPVAFVGGQLGVMFGFWLVAFLAAGLRYRPDRETDPGVRLLWWCSVPVWGLFVAASFVKSGQPNWPAPAYVGGLVLAVAWVRGRFATGDKRLPWVVGGFVALGLAAAVAAHFPALIRPTLARFSGPATTDEPAPVRRLDPTARLSGWKELAAEVDRVRGRVAAKTGREAVVAGTHWTLPGALGFYCAGHPDVYSIGLGNRSDRHSQYDVWRPNPVADAQAFRGRSFVIVGDIGPTTLAAFDRVEPPRRVLHVEHGVPVAGWAVWVCHGFRGFDPAGEATGPRY